MRVSAAQIVCRPGDVAGNLRQVEMLSREAAKDGARFVLFAEGALTGYVFTPEILACALPFDGAEALSLSALSGELGIGIAVGTLEREAAGCRVAQWVFLPDGRSLSQHKHRLTAAECAAGILRGERERRLFVLDGLTFAVLICADNHIEGVDEELRAAGVDILCAPCAGGGKREWMRRPEELRDPEVFRAYAECLARVCFIGGGLDRNLRNNFGVIAVNLVGDDGIDSFHPGHSSISDCDGRLEALLPGDYVPAWHRPRLISGEILAGKK